MITSYQRGHLIKFVNNEWLYVDNNTSIAIERPCVKCNLMPTLEGYDPCLGHIEGATSACCGHGVEDGFVVMEK